MKESKIKVPLVFNQNAVYADSVDSIFNAGNLFLVGYIRYISSDPFRKIGQVSLELFTTTKHGQEFDKFK